MDTINVIETGLSAVFILFQRIINSFPSEWSLYLSVVLMILIFRFLIFPAFGVSGSSDTAKKGKKKSSGKKGG